MNIEICSPKTPPPQSLLQRLPGIVTAIWPEWAPIVRRRPADTVPVLTLTWRSSAPFLHIDMRAATPRNAIRADVLSEWDRWTAAGMCLIVVELVLGGAHWTAVVNPIGTDAAT